MIHDYQNNVRVNLFGENDSFKILGSYPGMIIFLFGALTVLSYFSFLWSQMNTMARDTYQSIRLANQMQDEFNDLNLNLLNFMPYYEIRLLKDLDTERYDIYDDDYEI